MRYIIFALLLTILLTPAVSSASPITYENILKGVNQERANIGLKALVRSTELDKIAEDRMLDMVKYNYFAHTNPTTSKTSHKFFPSPNPNYSGSGIVEYKYVGEILARKFKTSEALVAGWMNSPTHKRAMLRKEYNRTGIAIHKGMVVQVFSN